MPVEPTTLDRQTTLPCYYCEERQGGTTTSRHSYENSFVWNSNYRLSLALSKTEIVVLKTIIPTQVGDLKIKPTDNYLGLKIDSKKSLGEQISRTAYKNATPVASLGTALGTDVQHQWPRFQ